MRRKIRFIQETLEKYFPDPEIPLDHKDPYTLLIAVLLSAQCTDLRVNQITPKLFARAKTPEQMVKLAYDEVLNIIRPCGLGPTKAAAILALSQILIDRHGSIVPQTLEELEALPGVGHKTASVVLCQAFQIPAMPVDTHIHRAAKRWGLSSGKSVTQTEADLKKAFPKKAWIKLHLQIILFCRTFCPARNHNENECPICRRLDEYA